MKKALMVLFAVMMIMSTSFVLADMSAPAPVVYSATVSNPEGAIYFDYSGKTLGTLPFGTEIKCYDNYDGRVEFSADNLENRSQFISEADITLGDLLKYKLGEKKTVMSVKNAPIYEKPLFSKSTEGTVLATIPDETQIVVQEYQADDISGGWSEWYYTSYQGNNGWISVDYFVVERESSEPLYATKTFTLGEGSNQITVPELTEITEIYDFWGETERWSYYIKYNGVGGVIPMDYLASKLSKTGPEDTYVVFFEGFDLYQEGAFSSEIAFENIPVGTKLEGEYISYTRYGWYDAAWIATTYQGDMVWFYTNEMPHNLAEAQKRLEENAKLDNMPHSVEEYASYYEKQLEDYTKMFAEDHATQETSPAVGPTPTTVEGIDTESETTIPTNDSGITQEEYAKVQPAPVAPMFSPMQIVILCILCAVVCGATAAVIIVLVNKRNK